MRRIRFAVTENRLADPARVTDADYLAHLETPGRSWVAEDAAGILGFASGRMTDGNVWALFVDPAHAGRGIGAALHDTMVAWLFDQGLQTLWLTTGRGTWAEGFYRRRGWQVDASAPGDEVRMTLESGQGRGSTQEGR